LYSTTKYVSARGGANKKRAKVTPEVLILALSLLCKALRHVCNITAANVKKTQLTNIPYRSKSQ
ncbi:MAG: hypothetical protein ACJAUL_003447, partial [Paraglaciecola sp.]